MRSDSSFIPHPSSFLFSAPVWLVVAICCVLPLSWIVWQIVSNPHVLVEAQLTEFRAALLARTLLYNLAAAVIATLLAFPAALVIGRGPRWVAGALWVLMPLSLLLPSITYAYGWTQFLRLLDVMPDYTGPGDIFRCIWSLATWLWAVPAGVVGQALRRLDPQIQQQALLDGAMPRVTARSLLGPIIAGVAIVAVLAVQEFAVYEPSGISVVATEVRMVFETGAFSSQDNPMIGPIGSGGAFGADQRERAAAAIATTLPLFGAIAVLAAIAAVALRKLTAAETVTVGPWPRVLNAPVWSIWASFTVVAIAVGVPLLSLVLSLRTSWDMGRIWSQFQPQVTGSLLTAGTTGIVALLVAFCAAGGGSTRTLLIALLTFLIGGQLLAIALIRLYNQPWLSAIYNAMPIVVMAYIARFGWIALLAARSTQSKGWNQLREMSAVDGADVMQTARWIVWPLAWPLLGAAAVLILILSLTEVPATVLLSPQRPPLLIPMLMTWIHLLRNDEMIEGSLLLAGLVFVLTLITVLLASLASRRRWRIESGGWRSIAKSILYLLSSILLLTGGCGDSAKPDDIWCESGQLVYPRALTYSPIDDSFFIIDRMARVRHINHDGKSLGEWRMPDFQRGKPVGVSVGPDGNVYVPDTHYHRVMVYSPDGQLVRNWGSFGTEHGQFIFPTDIAFDSRGNVFVSEYGDNDRIQVFTPKGEFLYAFGRYGAGDGEFQRPQSMVIDGDLLYITDSCNHRISVFKTDGTFVRNMGSSGSALGQFRYPYGLDHDSDGNLVVCEFGNNRIQLVDKETGRGIKAWGIGGHDPGQLAYPWAVAVDKHDRVVAVDSGNNRLQVFDF